MGFELAVHSPYFWFIFLSFFVSLSLNTLIKKRSKKQNPEEFRTGKIIRVLVYLSLALIFFICSIIFPGAEKLKDIQLLFFFIILTLAFFLVLKFKKAIGIPVLILGSTSVVFFILFLQSLTAFTGETEISRIRVLNMENRSMVLALDYPQSIDVRITMKGEYFAPVVKVVILDDFFVFFGARTLYRFVGMTSYEEDKATEITKQVDIYPFETPMGLSASVYRFFMDNESWLPGIKTVQTDVPQKKARILQAYSLRVQDDGGVEIILTN